MTIQITQEQLQNIIENATELGKFYEQSSNEPDENYETLMSELIGEDWLEVDGVYDFENSSDFYLYVYCNIMTEDFKEFVNQCKLDLAGKI
jgi:hypothetical protein